MPQFDPTWYPSQIFWLAVIFAFFYFLMARVALPRITQVLEERHDKIHDDLAKAESLKYEASEVQAAYEKSLAEARAEAGRDLKAANDAIAAKIAERDAEFARQIAARLGEAETRINGQKDKALAEIRSVAVEAAAAVSGKLLGEPVDAKVAEQAMAEVQAGEKTS